MNNEREELAKVLVAAYDYTADPECPCKQDLEIADAILAAGYRKPRTITTVEELDALGFESVVLDPCGTPAVCRSSTKNSSSWSLGGPLINSATLLMSGTSCVVLYEGGAE